MPRPKSGSNGILILDERCAKAANEASMLQGAQRYWEQAFAGHVMATI